VRRKRGRRSSNSPILHCKETFVGTDYPHKDRFAELTAAEEASGLYRETPTIGTRHGWERLLRSHGLGLDGHRLTRLADR
jgi:hypothetical protein